MIQSIDQLTYGLIKDSLNASSERGRIIAQNIANVETKGYKAYNVVFEDKLKDALNNDSVHLTTTNSMHIDDGSSLPNVKYSIERDTSTSIRSDGNNVDIDKEMSDLAANTILYNTLISQANSRIAMRRTVIEGK